MKKRLALSILGLSLLSGVAEADVKGQFTVDKTTIAPKHACAYPVRNQFNPREWQVEIVLSEGPCDAQAAIASLDPHTEMINQEGLRSGNYVLLFVDPSGKVGMNATLSETMTQYLDSTVTGLKAELTVNTADRVAGHIYNAEPVKAQGGGTYKADFTIDMAVTRPPAGTKLPANGGDPGKALAALYAAIGKKDMNAIRTYVTEERMARMEEDYNTPEENLASVVDTLGMWLPKKNMKIVGGELHGETAVLEVEGDIYEGTPGMCLVRMVKGPSGWALKEARMAGML